MPLHSSGQPWPYRIQPAESQTESIWKHLVERAAREPLRATSYHTAFPPLLEDIHTDIAIVGAGITGMTTAILLQRAGLDVVVVDAHPVGYGVSGFNSGHLTSMLLDMRFKNLLADFGEEAVREVVLALEEAISLVEQLVREYRIDCDFQRVSGYLYTESFSDVRAMLEEYEAATRAGLAVMRTYNVMLPFGVEEAIHVPQQAVLNPLGYVQALSLALMQAGGLVFENTRVLQVESHPKAARMHLQTDMGGSITARRVVLATHTPLGIRPGIQTRLEPMRSYVLGLRTRDRIGNALYWDMQEPYHYLRLAEDEHGPLLILGGEDHKTGEPVDTERRFQRLENYALERFNIDSIDYRWSAQFYQPADGLPYIGRLSDVYVATGYAGEGLAFGTLAGRLISDQLLGIPHPCTEIVSPTRAKPLASAGNVIAEGLNVMGHYVKDRLKKSALTTLEQVPLGEGAICQISGQKVAVYHGPDDIYHTFSPICTHMHCLVHWNATEKSWDCPCHGGRFSATGEVLNGPPVENLQPMDFSDSE